MLSIQQECHCLGIGKMIKILNEGNRPAAPLSRMVVPLSAANSDAVIALQPFFSAGGNVLFTPAAKKLLQVHAVGSILLLLCEMNIGYR